MGYSQVVKAPVFDTGIPGSNPGTPATLLKIILYFYFSIKKIKNLLFRILFKTK